MTSEYPRDEFDDAPQDGPVGVHRQPRSPWYAVLPFLLVLIVVPLLAWGATALIRGSGSSFVDLEAEQSQSVVEEEEDIQSGDVEEEIIEEEVIVPAPDPEDGPTAAPEDPDDLTPENNVEQDNQDEDGQESPDDGSVDFNMGIAVLNGSGIEGLAGIGVELLNGAGFTNAWGDNAADNVTPANTVYYRDASSYATALRVSEALGISNMVESTIATNYAEIVVLLRTEF